MKAALVAIAKNEEKALPEWLAYHLNIGFDEIFIYDNESQDKTKDLIAKVKQHFPVHLIAWGNKEGVSPQVSAYNHFLSSYSKCFDWVAFFDLDEFLVIKSKKILKIFLVLILTLYPQLVLIG